MPCHLGQDRSTQLCYPARGQKKAAFQRLQAEPGAVTYGW